MKKINFKWLLLSIVLSLASVTNVWGSVAVTWTASQTDFNNTFNSGTAATRLAGLAVGTGTRTFTVYTTAALANSNATPSMSWDNTNKFVVSDNNYKKSGIVIKLPSDCDDVDSIYFYVKTTNTRKIYYEANVSSVSTSNPSTTLTITTSFAGYKMGSTYTKGKYFGVGGRSGGSGNNAIQKVIVYFHESAACTAPSSVTVAPTNANGWRYSIGETIDLSCTATGGSGGSYTYQWQKYVGSAWTDINKATNATAGTSNLKITNCASTDGGSYRCVVSTGTGCELASDGYFIRVFTLNGNYSGSGFSENAIVWSDANTGVATVNLNASSIYEFKVYDNDGKVFGNGANNYIIQPVNWDCGTGNSNCRLLTGPAGDYTFTINISHAADNSPYVNVQVGYPSVSHPSTGYMYITKWWDHCYVHYWEGTNNALSVWGYDPEISSDRYVDICGTNYWYFPVVGTYNKFIAKDAAGDPSNTTGDQVSTDHGGKYITHDGSWGWHDFTTYTITYAANGGGSSMSPTSGICPSADQALTANAFSKTGYTFGGWKANVAVTIDGVSKAAGTVIDNEETLEAIGSDITLTAQWTAKQCTVTFDKEGGTGTISNVTATYDAAMPSKVGNLPEKTGYDFGGFWDGDNGTGTKYYNADGTSARNWDKNTTSTTTLYAKWTAHVYTVTLNADGGSVSPASISATYQSELGTSTVVSSISLSNYTYAGFYTEVAGGGTNLIGTDKKWIKNKTGYTSNNNNPKWIATSDVTLYVKWTRTVIIDDNGGSADGSVDVVYKGTASTPSVPTYAGHTVDLGYYAESGCSTKVMNLDGTLVSGVSGWTNASSKWIQTGSNKLYAHWKCNTPTITDNGNNTVTITVPSGTTVRYTTDGTNPSSSTGTVYSTTFSIAADCTVKAIAYQSNCTDSEIASQDCDYTAPANFQMIANSSAASDAELDNNESISQGLKNCATLTGGTAVYSNADGDSKSMKVKKPNNSGQQYGWYFNLTKDVITITMSAHIIKVGTVISITGYASGGNGVKINGYDSYLVNSGSEGNFTTNYTVLSTDANLLGTNVLTLAKKGSTYVYSLTISNCQSGTPCTTPTLPSLSNQAGCSYSAWNATPSNASTISAAGESISYSWKKGATEKATTASYTPDADGTDYTVTVTVSKAGKISTSVTSSALTATKYGNPSVTGPSDAEYVVDESASNLSVTATPTHGESLTYQWYSNTSKSTSSPTPTALENCTTSTYKPSTAETGTTYYFCKVSGGCEDVYSSIATVTVTEAPCFEFAGGTKDSGWPVAIDGSITTSLYQTSTGAVLTGGTVVNSGTVTIGSNDGVKGLVFDAAGNNAITITLSGTHTFAVETVITISGASGDDNSSSNNFGFSVNGNNLETTSLSTAKASFEKSYTVAASDGVEGGKTIQIKLNTSCLRKTYLKSVTVTGCVDCTPIDPELTYSKTTFWMDDADKTATPTLSGYYGTPTISYASSDPTVVRVDNSSTGAITALKRGTATITATISETTVETTDYCGNTADCEITVKDVSCGEVVIAGVTATSKNAGTPEGTLIASSSGYKVNLLDWKSPDEGCGTGGKIGGDNNYIYLTLKSGEYFQDGDKVIVNIAKVPNVGDSKLHIYDGTTTLSDESTMIGTSGTPTCGENEIVLSDVPANTSSITLHRGNGPTSATLQNPYVISMKVKRYICPDSKEFLPTGESGNWNATANWIGSTGRGASLPTSSDRVVISKPVAVNVTTAAAKDVLINQYSGATGKLTINSDAVLQVVGTIQKTTTGTTRVATAVSDVVIECSKTSQGALIFDQPSSGSLQTKGTVNFYTRSYRDGTSKKLQWQYVGYPFISGTDEDYDGYYINKYSETQGKWIVMRDQGDRSIAAWEGLAIAGDGEGGAQLQGTFAPTTNQSITLSKTTDKGGGENLVGNSWTAPIQLADMSASDFGDATATVYIFNTGRYNDDDGKADVGTSGHTAGQWLAIPIEGANWSKWAGMKVIPAFQAFEVITPSATTLSLDYSKVVRSATNTMNAELHAPARRGVEASEVDGYRIRVADSLTQTDMYIFEDMSFTTGFDNGWEGYYMPCDGRSAQLYAQTALGKMAVAALPDLEGTLLGFKPGKSSEYTFSFGTNAGGYYLNDLKTQTSTLIEEGETYTFTWENGDSVNRFMISATPFAGMPSGLDEISGKTDKVQKIIYNDHVYIIRGGKIYGVDGTTVK